MRRRSVPSRAKTSDGKKDRETRIRSLPEPEIVGTNAEDRGCQQLRPSKMINEALKARKDHTDATPFRRRYVLSIDVRLRGSGAVQPQIAGYT